MTLVLQDAPDGARGFDCNFALTADEASTFKAHGYDFAMRYLRRGMAHPYDITPVEFQIILGAGLKVMLVQHVESALSWVPSGDKGQRYALAAVDHARSLGWLPGALIWCDLEGVAEGTPEQPVIDYCNAWYDVVKAAGFVPGGYIGWHCGLSATSLYKRLKFQHYWAAYNLNIDQQPIVRGVQMHQWAITKQTRERDVPPGITFSFDVNTVLADKLGGRPTWVGRAA